MEYEMLAECKRCSYIKSIQIGDEEEIGPKKYVYPKHGYNSIDKNDTVVKDTDGRLSTVECAACGCTQHNIEAVQQW